MGMAQQMPFSNGMHHTPSSLLLPRTEHLPAYLPLLAKGLFGLPQYASLVSVLTASGQGAEVHLKGTPLDVVRGGRVGVSGVG